METINRIGNLIVLGLVILFAGCKDGETDINPGTNTFVLEDFKTVDLSESAEVVTTDPDIVGIVSEIRVVNDSIIALSQVRSDNNVILYNLCSGKHQIANRRGAGPLDLIYVGSLSVDSDGNLIIAGVFDRKVISARWNPDGDDAVAELKFSHNEDCPRSVTGPGDNIIALSSPLHQMRLIVVDGTGQLVDSLGSFPAASLPDSVMPTNYMFQADLACSPEAGKIAVSTMSWNEISICNLDGSGDEIILKGPVFPKLNIVNTGGSIGIRYSPQPMWFMFFGACASEDRFAVGYRGVEVKKEADFDRWIGSILEFDWEGNPKRRLILPEEATAFDIDYSKNILYTVENLPDPTLVRYQLKN